MFCYLASSDEDSQQSLNNMVDRSSVHRGAVPKRSQVAAAPCNTSNQVVALPNSRLPTPGHHLPALLPGERIKQIPSRYF